ncbi:multisubunit sodium/proton antiporter, MrpF subunit (2.A.63.1) [Methanosalsum zhilinae DSM 4017]|uniref:Multisubunit sodium/proton antiporter, MrpF subunit (2.A.63.1) n=1 Tax=Methanosalsum zhilinae (strain DSM 4017 / NBRC 107636 / OCM 62 / WeN5) TaxID=679901 RepID=F7XLW5_METZD|nr:cation:proton antiporter [Methanosalsum zhilinae]AEH60893.1 multisubunit sodium/proton antiporter, MrpF subunit (2.A.63.1) [Methanosalsum zhilinae DSM 4017]
MSSILLNFALTFMAFALVPCIYRIIRGPTIPDRVVALDAMAMVIVVMLGVFSYVRDSVYFMDAALVLAIIAFVGTIAIAKYIDKGVVF